MNIKQKFFSVRDAGYFGHNMQIPRTHRYLATDKDGCLRSFPFRPTANREVGIWVGRDSELIAEVELPAGVDWHESLRGYV